MICAEAEIDQTKLSTGSRAARIFYHKVAPASPAEHCGKPLVTTYWTNMMGTREGGEENRKYYEEDTAFWCLRGGRAFCACKGFLRLIFLGLARANPCGPKCCQNYHQHVRVSCTWTAGEKQGEKAVA